MPYNLVGFESTFLIDPEDATERIISFQLLVNTCEEENQPQLVTDYLA